MGGEREIFGGWLSFYIYDCRLGNKKGDREFVGWWNFGLTFMKTCKSWIIVVIFCLGSPGNFGSGVRYSWFFMTGFQLLFFGFWGIRSKNLDNEEKQIKSAIQFFRLFINFHGKPSKLDVKIDFFLIHFFSSVFCWSLGVDKRPLADTEICHYQGRKLFAFRHI